MSEPLILTLRFDPASFERFERLRQAHFPPALNKVPAHATLFHNLPGEHLAEVTHELRSACAGTPPLTLRATGLRSLGGGVTYELASSELAALRRRLADRWAGWLTRQDQQGWRPHVTVQNKVTPGEAKTLKARLDAAFTPFDVRGKGLLLWWYRGGPWDPAGDFAFEGV